MSANFYSGYANEKPASRYFNNCLSLYLALNSILFNSI